ncbi:MAG: cadmium-translocating P-type ATPase [Rhodospirillales bacterium]|nr:cadmium-translocating P-type ATPase [Rhodospirillales bacterium]
MSAAALAARPQLSAAEADLSAREAICAHCGLPAPAARRFCCPGCAAAFETIQGLGLGRYYTQRVLDPAGRPPRPDIAERWDLSRYVTSDSTGRRNLSLAVDGLQCGACVWLIESVLGRDPTLLRGRVNMTTRRLALTWQGTIEQAERYVAAVERLGYRLVPFDASCLAARDDHTGRALLRALAVAGFAAGNTMLTSAGIWAGFTEGMGPATRSLMYWVSAMVAMPAIAYAGLPFFRSAFAALRHGRTNMDVPVSIGVVVVTAMSLIQTIQGAEHAYFDSAIALLFFLLIGRVLDHQARGRARATAEQLLTLRVTDIAVLQPNGTTRRTAQESITPGVQVLVTSGERIGVDGVVEGGTGPVDTSLVTGESLPVAVSPGMQVFAGTVNLGGALTVRATATGNTTLLAECVRLVEAAETRRGRFVEMADRVARHYAPTVHVAAALTFLWWWLVQGAGVGAALLTGCSVLIVTCPCALALAVPAVQVIAAGRLFRSAILLKSATALERLATVDTVVFDKTGTLTEPLLALTDISHTDSTTLRLAAGLAISSHHPLARALVTATGPVAPIEGVSERPGLGLEAQGMRLGSRAFAGDPDAPPAEGPELWLSQPDEKPICFRFDEQLRTDAADTLARLRAMGLRILLASGDREGPVGRVAATLGITKWQAGCSPVDKVALVETLRASSRGVMMVGDGLNDSPSLAAATVSASPATAADISQTIADVVFQGRLLRPVLTSLSVARRARAVMRQNIGLSIGYNCVMVPLAVAGYITPWLAAAAMSASSLSVILNSFRLHGARQ